MIELHGAHGYLLHQFTGAGHAEAALQKGQAERVALARDMLYDPPWPWHAVVGPGGSVDALRRYWCSQPREFKALFRNALLGQR